MVFLLFQYREHRCLYAEECLNFTDYKTNQCVIGDDNHARNCLKLVIPTNTKDPGMCAADCPAGYNTNPKDEQKCDKCVGRCPKSKFLLRLLWK